MGVLREWIQRLSGTLRTARRDADLEEELRFHLEMAAADAERRGRSAEEASRVARVRSGGIAPSIDALRDQRGWPWLNALKLDAIFGMRHLNKHRTLTAAAVLSLGLPVADPDRLFYVTR